MKFRAGFVANSSSTSFVITNKSDSTKTLLDFALSILPLFEQEVDPAELRACGGVDDCKRIVSRDDPFPDCDKCPADRYSPADLIRLDIAQRLLHVVPCVGARWDTDDTFTLEPRTSAEVRFASDSGGTIGPVLRYHLGEYGRDNDDFAWEANGEW